MCHVQGGRFSGLARSKESIGLPIEDQEREQELRSWVLAVSEGKRD